MAQLKTQKSRQGARRRSRLPRQGDLPRSTAPADVPRRPARRSQRRLRAAGRILSRHRALLQCRDCGAATTTSLTSAVSRVTDHRVGRRAARSAGDQLSGLARPQTRASSSTSPRRLAGGSLSRSSASLSLMFTLRPIARRSACCATSPPGAGASSTQRRARNLSGAAARCGGATTLAVRYLLRPGARRRRRAAAHRHRSRLSLQRSRAPPRARRRSVFELCIQRYVDDDRRRRSRTRRSNGARRALRRCRSPTLTSLEARCAHATSRRSPMRARSTRLAFNPWNTTDEFRPLGHLNRARKAAYDASAAHRLALALARSRGRRFATASSAGRACGLFESINRVVEWHRLPLRRACSISTRSVIELRSTTSSTPSRARRRRKARPVPPDRRRGVRTARSYDGRDNDLSTPRWARSARPSAATWRPIIRPGPATTPNPVTVSASAAAPRARSSRRRSLNILAAAWIQFQVHDWVNHARHPLGKDDVVVPMPGGMKWTAC